MQTAERLASLELALTPQVGAMSFLKLLQAFSTATAVWSASSTQLQSIISSKAIAAISTHQGQEALQAALTWVIQRKNQIQLSGITYPPHSRFCK